MIGTSSAWIGPGQQSRRHPDDIMDSFSRPVPDNNIGAAVANGTDKVGNLGGDRDLKDAEPERIDADARTQSALREDGDRRIVMLFICFSDVTRCSLSAFGRGRSEIDGPEGGQHSKDQPFLDLDGRKKAHGRNGVERRNIQKGDVVRKNKPLVLVNHLGIVAAYMHIANSVKCMRHRLGYPGLDRVSTITNLNQAQKSRFRGRPIRNITTMKRKRTTPSN